MKTSVGLLAGVLAGAIACSASAAEAHPVLLADDDMDMATAGVLSDSVLERLAAIRERLLSNGIDLGDIWDRFNNFTDDSDVDSFDNDVTTVIERHVSNSSSGGSSQVVERHTVITTSHSSGD